MEGKATMNKIGMLVLFLVMMLGCTGCQNKEGKLTEALEGGFSDIPELDKEVIEQSQLSLDDTIIVGNEEEETYISSLEDEFLDIPEVFRAVLRQYLQIPVGTNLYSDIYREKVTQGDWKDVYEYLGGKDKICYSLSDLTDDGFPELIMGRYSNADDSHREYVTVSQVQGTSWENSYVWIYVVYYYNGNEVKQVCECEGNHIELYENGIIHYSGGGVFQPMQYLQFQTDTENYETGAYVELKIDNGEVIGYLKEVGDDYVEITEDEYNQIVNQYTTSPVELEWTVLR